MLGIVAAAQVDELNFIPFFRCETGFELLGDQVKHLAVLFRILAPAEVGLKPAEFNIRVFLGFGPKFAEVFQGDAELVPEMEGREDAHPDGDLFARLRGEGTEAFEFIEVVHMDDDLVSVFEGQTEFFIGFARP